MPTHWEGPLFGSHTAAGGLCEDVPAELVARRDAMFWYNDFITEDDGLIAAGSWVATDIGVAVAAGTGIVGGGDMGQYNIDAGTADATGRQVQLAGTLNATTGLLALNDTNRNLKSTAWEARIRLTPVTDGVGLVGMCVIDTTLLTAADPALVAFTDGMFFLISSGTVAAFVRRGSANLGTFTTTLANNAFIQLGMRVRPASVAAGTGLTEVYVNGVLRQRINGGIPNAGLAPSLAVVNGTGVDCDMFCDYMWAAATR